MHSNACLDKTSQVADTVCVLYGFFTDMTIYLLFKVERWHSCTVHIKWTLYYTSTKNIAAPFFLWSMYLSLNSFFFQLPHCQGLLYSALILKINGGFIYIYIQHMFSKGMGRKMQ